MSSRRVRLVGAPTDLYRQMQEHSDELRRELKLLTDAGEGGQVPARLLGLLQKIEEWFPAVLPFRTAILEARRRGEFAADVEVEVSAEDVRGVRYLHELFNEVEDYCRSGDLLTVELAPQAHAVRAWVVEEAERQFFHDAVPRPWPGGGREKR